MKAVIMAGGEGSRLRPLTCGIPKPMVPVLNKPVMEHIIGLLKKYDITDIAATLWYLPSEITDYFEDGGDLGVKLNYYIESSPLGTGGSVLNAEEFLDDTFIVISGDAMTDINLSLAVEFHRSRGSKATLILKREPIPLEYGIVITDKYGRINKFLEKPSWGEVFSDTINTGIYILEPEVLSYYKRGENFDFSKDLFPRLLKDNIPMFGYITDGYWCDIGDLSSYKQTHFDILSGKVNILPDFTLDKNVTIGKNTIISSGAKLIPPVYIGDNCIIKPGAVIDSYSVIGNNCTVGENTSLKRSILWSNSNIGRNNQCRSTIICSRVNMQNGINLFEDSVIGNGCTLSDNVTVMPGIKIWPSKKIKEDAIVNKNLIWGTKSSRVLFGERGISGEFNIDITPEFASLLGAAYASSSNKAAPLIISSDDSAPSRLIKESLISGVLSSGAKVIDIGDVVIPMNRYGIKLYNASGGIHVSMDTLNEKLKIELINEAGGNIDRKTEKKVENLFFREDFKRCSTDMVSSAIRVENFVQLYLQSIEQQIKNLTEIKSTAYKILISSPKEITLNIAASLLKNLGCSVYKDFSAKSKPLHELAKQISNLVKNNNYDMGVILSENGENIVLIDENGSVIDNEKYPILASLITLKSGCTERLIIPQMSTVNIEKLAQKYNTEVIRTKSAFSELINAVLRQVNENNASQLQYILYFDGIYAVAKILDFMIESSTTLHRLESEIPPLHIRSQELNCDFEQRGNIIRRLIEEGKPYNLELFDGIKLSSEKGWSLVLPNNERSVFNIYTEGFSEEYADELSGSIVDKLKGLIGEGSD